MVSREKQNKLNISWEEPEEPNDHTLNYTVSITDISSGIELSRTIIDMYQHSVLSRTLSKCAYMYKVTKNLLRFIVFILVQGIPYNVTVFATNGRGKGLDISGVYFAVEDG